MKTEFIIACKSNPVPCTEKLCNICTRMFTGVTNRIKKFTLNWGSKRTLILKKICNNPTLMKIEEHDNVQIQ